MSSLKNTIMKPIRHLCSIALFFICSNCSANNIVLSNITSVTGSNYVQLQFDLSWENSWNNAINRDAAWIFFKFKDYDGTWRHLNLTNANNSITSGYTIQVPTDLTGAFIYRNSGSGTVTLTGVQVGVNVLPGSFDIKGFAIEMVRIPMESTYYVGDGSGISTYQSGVTGTPLLINANTITMGTTSGQLNDPFGNGVLAANFPIGYNTAGASLNLYMMKHEITQGAYRDFLNALTYTQQATRTGSAPNSVAGTMANGLGGINRRNGLKIATPGVSTTTAAVYGCDLNNNSVYNETTDGEWLPDNYLTYMDVAAFLDWAALRPMTEMEFEKASRGPLTAISGEFASGTNAINTGPIWPLSNSGATNEVVTTYSGSAFNTNITYQATAPSGNAPLRVGINATAYATRISAGAGYYGALDLSGNVFEVAVSTQNAAGRSYTGVSGNGTLNAAGDADQDFWPGINGNTTTTNANLAYAGTGVTGAAGIVQRGGCCGTTSLTCQVSYHAPGLTTDTRSGGAGGRGVKSF
jgi:formylglycine-generating enzyme required for sulfatase activity